MPAEGDSTFNLIPNNDVHAGGLRREPSLPAEYIPELEQAAQRAGLNWKDFQLTDNSCKPHPPAKSLLEKVLPQSPLCGIELTGSVLDISGISPLA